MLRVMEARKAAHAAGTGDVVLEFLDGDLKTTVGPDGAYQPVWGILKASAGNITLITKMVCRRKDAPDQAPVKVFHLTNGLSLAEFNDLFRFDAQGMDLPKLPVFGGYEVVLTMTTDALADISWVTKGYNTGGTAPSATGLAGTLGMLNAANPQYVTPTGVSYINGNGQLGRSHPGRFNGRGIDVGGWNGSPAFR